MIYDVLFMDVNGFTSVKLVVAMSKVDAMHLAETLYNGTSKDAVKH